MSDHQKYQLKKLKLEQELVTKLSRLALIVGGILLVAIWLLGMLF